MDPLRSITHSIPKTPSPPKDAWSTIQLFIFLAGLLTWARSAWNILYRYAENTCLATVHIKDSDPLYHDVLTWMNDHVFAHNNFRSVLATTNNNSSSYARRQEMTSAGGEKIFIQNLARSWPKKTKSEWVLFNPFQGSRVFRFQGRWIYFTHAPPISAPALAAGGLGRGAWGGNDAAGVENAANLKLQTLDLSFSFSFTPSLQHIRHFLTSASLYANQLKRKNTSISIYRAIANARDVVRWNCVTLRPARPLNTVILEKEKKNAVVSDLAEYLQPETRQWYADHGIPYRRGYLFSGPPGTGKTSLSSAIAGSFGLDVYVLSLLDANITEAHFLRLFSEVPERCVVLLEDIDAAGMSLRRPVQDQQPQGQLDRREARREGRKAGSRPLAAMADNAPAYGGITLSGLLNAIDGVSSQEGRVLIMTTNSPQSLDPALIRPGRVDLHVRFDLPTKAEFRELFCNMFNDAPGLVNGRTTRGLTEGGEKGGEKADDKEKAGEKEKEIALDALAASFADKLPEQKLSLAEVQGFLMQYKRKPEEACANAEEWIASMEAEEQEREQEQEPEPVVE